MCILSFVRSFFFALFCSVRCFLFSLSLSSCLQNCVLLFCAIRFWPFLLHHRSVRSLIGLRAKNFIDCARPRISSEPMCMNFVGRRDEMRRVEGEEKRRRIRGKDGDDGLSHSPTAMQLPTRWHLNTTIYRRFTFIHFIERIYRS